MMGAGVLGLEQERALCSEPGPPGGGVSALPQHQQGASLQGQGLWSQPYLGPDHTPDQLDDPGIPTEPVL